MVTDIMDNTEPIRLKLRSLGTDVLSDTNLEVGLPSGSPTSKFHAIIALLDIAGTMGMISDMNRTILACEFEKLIQPKHEFSLEGFLDFNSPLEEYPKGEVEDFPPLLNKERGRGEVLHRATPEEGNMRIGVQRGGTLMKAISDKIKDKTGEARPSMLGLASRTSDFDVLKKDRRNEILKIIKDSPAVEGKKSATISDIRLAAEGTLANCGEKTLQRELASMVQNGLLKKVGEKRWSKYFIKDR